MRRCASTTSTSSGRLTTGAGCSPTARRSPTAPPPTARRWSRRRSRPPTGLACATSTASSKSGSTLSGLGGLPARCRQLALARVVQRFAEHHRRLLRRMEAHRVLGGDEVQAPLGLALQLERGLELGLGRALLL